MRLLMVGDGELRREVVNKYATQRNLPVTFTGSKSIRKIVGAYVASDCWVLPADHGETWDWGQRGVLVRGAGDHER